jgi:hypothetical protein
VALSETVPGYKGKGRQWNAAEVEKRITNAASVLRTPIKGLLGIKGFTALFAGSAYNALYPQITSCSSVKYGMEIM